MSLARRSSIVRRSWALLVPLALAAGAGALEAGAPAPNFTAPSLDGGPQLSLASRRGKVVYLDFWASWCQPCLTSLPLLDGLRTEFAARGFEVLAVNVDRDPEQARRFLARLDVGYPSASDPEGRIPEQFGIETMPTSFLIDRQGVIRYVHDGFRRGDIEPLRARIAELLAAGK
jgi:peroxiredoxin